MEISLYDKRPDLPVKIGSLQRRKISAKCHGKHNMWSLPTRLITSNDQDEYLDERE